MPKAASGSPERFAAPVRGRRGQRLSRWDQARPLQRGDL